MAEASNANDMAPLVPCATAIEDAYDDYEQDDGLDEDGNFKFECARFWIKGEGWYCPMAGTEECDWECPE